MRDLSSSNAVAQKCRRRMSPFVGEEVVPHVQARHRPQVAAHDALRDEGAHFGERVVAVLNGVECLGARVEARGVRFVPLGDPRVQIPAVVVEPDVRPVRQRADRGHVLLLERREADDDVRHLDAGVVDVILHFDRPALEPERADERVAERRVPQVPDVRGLVRVDRRVFDDDLADQAVGRRRRPGAHLRRQKRRPVEVEIQVAVRRGLDLADALDGPDRASQRLRDRPWRLAQLARQLEGDRHGEVAERAPRRRLDDDGGPIGVGEAEGLFERAREARADGRVQRENHARRLFYFAVVGRVVDVGQQLVHWPERGQLHGIQLPHTQDGGEVGQLEPARADGVRLTTTRAPRW